MLKNQTVIENNVMLLVCYVGTITILNSILILNVNLKSKKGRISTTYKLGIVIFLKL